MLLVPFVCAAGQGLRRRGDGEPGENPERGVNEWPGTLGAFSGTNEDPNRSRCREPLGGQQSQKPGGKSGGLCGRHLIPRGHVEALGRSPIGEAFIEVDVVADPMSTLPVMLAPMKSVDVEPPPVIEKRALGA